MEHVPGMTPDYQDDVQTTLCPRVYAIKGAPCDRVRGGVLSSLGGGVIRIRILMYRDVSCVYPEGYMYP
jgi:hypothetical protein